MSAAIYATSARERAAIAARFIRAGRTQSRALFNCFEMGDGDEVAAILRAKNDPRINAVILPLPKEATP